MPPISHLLTDTNKKMSDQTKYMSIDDTCRGNDRSAR